MRDASLSKRPSSALAAMRGVHAWLQTHPLALAGASFAAALAIYIALQVQIVPGMGLWYDELFSLWAGDPRLTFGDAFATRILPDTNGPIYFSLVYFAQAAGLTGRVAFLVVNFVVIGLVFAVLLQRGWRFGILATALSCVALSLVTAPLLVYGPEGRVYGMVMALCVLIAFEGSRVVAGGKASRADLILMSILGALAAWMHVFGAIFAGSLAAALVVAGAFVLRRRDVVVFGIVAGVATTAAFLVWIVFAFPLFTGTTSWIQFNSDWVFNALWTVKLYMVGPMIGVVVALGFVVLSLIPRHSRPMALVLVITGALFIAIPLAVSMKMPIFMHRYLLVGFPGLMVLCLFLLRSHLLANDAPQIQRQGLAGLGALFLVFPLAQGVPTARDVFAERPAWYGERQVLQAAASCPAGEIRTISDNPLQFGFDYLLQGRLKVVSPLDAPVRDIAGINCPVFAWAEHFKDPWVVAVSADQVLQDFRLTNTTGIPLTVHRHRGGVVLARADAKLD